MAKSIYIGVSNTARKVKKAYIGVSNTARKVKKAYIGVGNTARQFYSSEPEVVYHGLLTTLSNARSSMTPGYLNNYLLFAGGNNNSGMSNVVDAYNSSYQGSTPTTLSSARNLPMPGWLDSYALFAGGAVDLFTATDVVDAYNNSLQRSTPAPMGVPRFGGAGGGVGNYALIAGGSNSGTGPIVNSVDAYNNSLQRSTPTTLSVARYNLAGAMLQWNDNYMLFGGGDIGQTVPSSVVDAYNSSLQRSTPTALSSARYTLGGEYLYSGYCLFGGGYENATVDAYNNSLQRSTPTALSVARRLPATTYDWIENEDESYTGYTIFAGGRTVATPALRDVVDCYNGALQRTILTPLSTGRISVGAVSFGYMVIAGGLITGENYTNSIEAYKIL